jgi:hypothetical protein
VLFQESTTGVPRFYVVVAIDHPEVQTVTVFNFEEENLFMTKSKNAGGG